MKKLFYIGLIVAMVTFFAFPHVISADEGDEYTWAGVDNDQYTVKNENSNVIEEVNCIDGDVYLTTGKNAYVETDIDVSDELVGEEALGDDDEDGVIFKNENPPGSIGPVPDYKEDGKIHGKL